jgi:hypothetical protein
MNVEAISATNPRCQQGKVEKKIVYPKSYDTFCHNYTKID